MGPLQYVNTLIRENNLAVRFHLTEHGNLKTDKYPNSRIIRKIEALFQRHSIVYTKRRDSYHRPLFLLVKRGSIPASTLAWEPVRADILIEVQFSESLERMKRIFCWSNGIPPTMNRYPFLSLNNVSLPYDTEKRPLFDERWIVIIKPLIDEDTVYSRPTDFLIQAQALSHKFLDRVPKLLEMEFRSCHPAILLTALCITMKAADESGLNTRFIAEKAFSFQVPFYLQNTISKSMREMERVFLKGINYETTPVEPIEHSMGLHLSRTSLNPISILRGREKGAYLIQKKSDHYLFTVITDKEKCIFKQKRFTIDEDLNFVEVLPKDSGEAPCSDPSLITLISRWGGKFSSN